MPIQSAANISGYIQGNGTKTEIIASFYRLNDVISGEITGKMEMLSGEVSKKYIFNSSNPLMLTTIKTGSFQYVEAVFQNVNVYEIPGNSSRSDFTTYLKATKEGSKSWVGSCMIKCSDCGISCPR